MPANDTHPCFQPPDDVNIKIWRYMDFTKYVSMLNSQALFFSRSDLLGDSYEGSYSPLNLEWRHVIYDSLWKKMPESFSMNYMSNFYIWLRQWTYINCWHMNEHESVLMWEKYGKIQSSLVVQSKYFLLKDCLPENVMIGTVNYVDYNSVLIPEGNIFWPYVHKRKSFEDERELRCMFQDFPLDQKEPLNASNELQGKCLNINLDNLIENVYISPEAPTWLLELTENVTKLYGFHFPINPSKLSELPTF